MGDPRIDGIGGGESAPMKRGGGGKEKEKKGKGGMSRTTGALLNWFAFRRSDADGKKKKKKKGGEKEGAAKIRKWRAPITAKWFLAGLRGVED